MTKNSFLLWNQNFRCAAHIFENFHRCMKIERWSKYCHIFTKIPRLFFSIIVAFRNSFSPFLVIFLMCNLITNYVFMYTLPCGVPIHTFHLIVLCHMLYPRLYPRLYLWHTFYLLHSLSCFLILNWFNWYYTIILLEMFGKMWRNNENLNI